MDFLNHIGLKALHDVASRPSPASTYAPLGARFRLAAFAASGHGA